MSSCGAASCLWGLEPQGRRTLSVEHAEWSASGIWQGSCVSQCMAVALKAKSTDAGGRHWL